MQNEVVEITKANEKKTFDDEKLNCEENDPTQEFVHDSTVMLPPLTVPKEIRNLSILLRKDNFNKENLFLLRNLFISWTLAEDGLVPAIEFEAQLKNSKTTLSWPTIDALISLIASKKDKSKLSYLKLKTLLQTLEEDQLYRDMHSSKQMRALIEDSLKPEKSKFVKSSSDNKHELSQLREGNCKKKSAHIDSYLNQIELRLEEKFKTICQAFRSFDTDGDSKLTFDEFWVGLDKVGISMNKQICRELFNFLDENKDQVIEFNEFWEFFETLKATKGDYQKYSKNTTQNQIVESIMKQQSLYGIANNGLSNSLKNKLMRGRNPIVSPMHKSATQFFKKQYDESVNVMDELLSTVSSVKSPKIRKEMPESLQIFKTPIPKNKDLNRFLSDWSSVKSLEYDKTPKVPLQKQNQAFGGTRNRYQNIATLLQHNYLTHHAEETKKKMKIFKQQQIEKNRKSKDWKHFRWNNAQKSRLNLIKHRYLSPPANSNGLP
jgi:hypothetical protein